MGRQKLLKETNIISIIQSRRYFNAALKLLMTKQQRNRLKERTNYLHVNPDSKKGGDKELTDLDTEEL